MEGCKSCDCDPIGAKGPQCDITGQCPCLDNVEGRRCDRCKENKYDRQRGCVDCPDCYNLVQNEAKGHLARLDRLIDILNKIENNPTVIDDDKFEEELKSIQDEVEKLLDQAKVGTGGDDETIYEKLEHIRKRQNEISRKLSEIEENVYLARNQCECYFNLFNWFLIYCNSILGDEVQANMTSSEKIMSQAESELYHAFESLNTDGKEALERAEQRAKEYGQQSEKMTTISKEARDLADTLDENADNIVKVAGEAKNQSIKAYEMAKNATDLQRNITQDVRLLKNELVNTKIKLNSVKRWTEEVYNKSLEAKTNAIILLNDVTNIIVPNVDVPKLKKEVEDTKNEAYRLLNETESLLDKSDKLLTEIEEQILTADDLLSKGVEQQDYTLELLSDIDLAKARAENAANLANEIYKEATATYETVSRK